MALLFVALHGDNRPVVVELQELLEGYQKVEVDYGAKVILAPQTSDLAH